MTIASACIVKMFHHRRLTRNGFFRPLLWLRQNRNLILACASLLRARRLYGRTYAFGVTCGRSGLRWQSNLASAGQS